MKNRPMLVCFLLLIVASSGCIRPIDSMISMVQLQAVTSTINNLQSTKFPPNISIKTQGVSPTPTTAKTNTKMPARTSTPVLARARMKVDCLEVLPELPDNHSVEGLLLVQKENLDERRWKTFLLNLTTGESIQLDSQGEILDDFYVSPDRNMVAFSSTYLGNNGQVTIHNLVIADNLGQRIKVLPWDRSWVGFFGWLDNQRLLFDLRGTDPEEIAVRKPGSLLVFNPFQESQQVLPQSYPEFLNTPWTVLPLWDSGVGVSYDPTLTRVVYPYRLEGGDQRYTYALFDLPEAQIVANLETVFSELWSSDFYPPPRWSPDGSKFVLLGVTSKPKLNNKKEFEIYSVSREGAIEQLTHLAGVALIWDTGYSWSMDSRLLAMLLGPSTNPKSKMPHVAVLDTETSTVVDTCITVMKEDNEPLAPIWSPLGRQLVVDGFYKGNPHQVLLIDLENGYAVQLADDMQSVGWMANK